MPVLLVTGHSSGGLQILSSTMVDHCGALGESSRGSCSACGPDAGAERSPCNHSTGAAPAAGLHGAYMQFTSV